MRELASRKSGIITPKLLKILLIVVHGYKLCSRCVEFSRGEDVPTLFAYVTCKIFRVRLGNNSCLTEFTQEHCVVPSSLFYFIHTTTTFPQDIVWSLRTKSPHTFSFLLHDSPSHLTSTLVTLHYLCSSFCYQNFEYLEDIIRNVLSHAFHHSCRRDTCACGSS
jgi:hypothetical protein